MSSSDTGRAAKCCNIALVSVPALVPLILSGMALLMYYQEIRLSGTYWAIVAAHVCYCSPFALGFIRNSYESLNIEIEQAARDLGAGAPRIIFQIVIPQLWPALVSAFAISFLLSWDEFILACLWAASPRPCQRSSLNARYDLQSLSQRAGCDGPGVFLHLARHGAVDAGARRTNQKIVPSLLLSCPGLRASGRIARRQETFAEGLHFLFGELRLMNTIRVRRSSNGPAKVLRDQDPPTA